MNWQTIKAKVSQWLSTISNLFGSGRVAKGSVIVFGLYLLICVVAGIYWSWIPGQFSVNDNAAVFAERHQQSVVVGTTTTAALIMVTSTLMDKPGGFVSNDLLPPGIWLDNITNWEYGALIQSRDLARALRGSFSRSQSQSQEDIDLGKAEPRLNFSSLSWAVPSSESEYRSAIKYLNRYLERLGDKGNTRSQFYARADNLNDWLAGVETRLGSLSQRLSASVGKRRLNTDLAGDDAAAQSTFAPNDLEVKTPWMNIDDVFYESRGAAWALAHFLRAIEVDFVQVLKKKNALVSLQQIIRELETTQQTLYSPMVLNGDGFGMLANHSLVMASYISRAHAAIIDLRSLLKQG